MAASLTGGNALATLVRMIQLWCMELGCNVPQVKIVTSKEIQLKLRHQEKIWSTALSAGMRETEVPSLVTLPTIFGERHCPDQKGSITNINQASCNNQANCFQYQDGWRHNFTIYQVHNRIQCLGIRNKTNTEYENIFISVRKEGTLENK